MAIRYAESNMPPTEWPLYIIDSIFYILYSIFYIIYYGFYIIYYQLYIIYYYDTHSMLRIKPSYLARFTAE